MNKAKKTIKQKNLTAEFPYTNGNLSPELTFQNYANCKIFCELFEKTMLNCEHGIDFYEMKNNFHYAFDFNRLICLRSIDYDQYTNFKKIYLEKLNEYCNFLKNADKTSL